MLNQQVIRVKGIHDCQLLNFLLCLLLLVHAASEHTLTEPGEYPYFCAENPNKVGAVIMS